MEMNLASMSYLFFRLAPFILVCFFALSSILNSELKGFVYLVGLCFTCFVTFMINGSLGEKSTGEKSLLCNSFSINNVYSDKTPASLIIFGYTFFYLVYPIAKYDLAIHNVPTLVLFPLLIIADMWWNFSHNCFPMISCAITLLIAGLCGVAWSYFIDKTKMAGLQYFNVGSNKEICTRPTLQRFKCVTKTR